MTVRKTDFYVSSPNGKLYTRIYEESHSRIVDGIEDTVFGGMDDKLKDRDPDKLCDRDYGNCQDILMIHGAASDAEYFAEASSLLAKDYRVITYDRCGHSRSIPADHARYTVEAEALDAAAVIKDASSGKVTVAAASAGCLVALSAAEICQEKIDKLILFEPAFAVTKEALDEISLWKEKLKKLSGERKFAGALLEFVKMIGGIDPDSPSVSLKQQAKNLKNFQLFLKKEMDAFFAFSDCKRRLEQLAVPCYLVVGDKDLEGLFRRTGLEAAQVLKMQPILVPGYHNFPKDHPEQYAEIIRDRMMYFKQTGDYDEKIINCYRHAE